MSDYGVTDKGFVRKRFDTILEEMQSDIKDGTGIEPRELTLTTLVSSAVYSVKKTSVHNIRYYVRAWTEPQ